MQDFIEDKLLPFLIVYMYVAKKKQYCLLCAQPNSISCTDIVHSHSLFSAFDS